jgi:hypothetical protein
MLDLNSVRRCASRSALFCSLLFQLVTIAAAATIAINAPARVTFPEGDSRDVVVTVTNVSDSSVILESVSASIDFSNIMFDASDFVRAVTNAFTCSGETLQVNQQCSSIFTLQSIPPDANENDDFGETSIMFTATPNTGEPVTTTLVARVTDVPEPALLMLLGIGVVLAYAGRHAIKSKT